MLKHIVSFIWLVTVAVITLMGGIPIDAVSLLLTLIQTVFVLMDYEEDIFMKNRMMVGSGACGVVQIFCGKTEPLQVCRVGSNPTRSTKSKGCLTRQPLLLRVINVRLILLCSPLSFLFHLFLLVSRFQYSVCLFRANSPLDPFKVSNRPPQGLVRGQNIV